MISNRKLTKGRHLATSISVSIGSDHGLVPEGQAIIWTKYDLLLIELLIKRNKIKCLRFNPNILFFIQENVLENNVWGNFAQAMACWHYHHHLYLRDVSPSCDKYM